MMTATKCLNHDQLKALTLGQFSGKQSDTLFQHIADCTVCRTELETLEDENFVDKEDSLIASLQDPDDCKDFSAEPDCRVAVVKALGALALTENAENRKANPEVESMPGAIGEYEILRPIGSGGMGNVFLARHTKLGREVALKVLASHRLADSRMLERFQAEMRAVGRLSHPNIVTAYDAREVDGMPVLVTEYVDGLDLGQLLQRTGSLDIADACEIARQISVALTYTNSQGFVHRDIKPSNVMLSCEGNIKLLDLGLARLQCSENSRTEITGTGQTMGTADYIAPEQVTDSKTVDIRADIYSLGCTLFKLLTGRAPFADEHHLTPFAKMTAHVSKKPPSLATVLPIAPSGLVKLVDSMLAKKPADRPMAPQDIAVALSAHCKDQDLRKLMHAAQALEPRKQGFNTSSPLPKPKSQSWMKRTVPFSVAIAAGLTGVLLGIILSIIIVITNPDGTKSILQLAEGSKVELREGSINGLNQPNADSAITPRSSSTPSQSATQAPADNDISPLSFAVLVNRDSTGHPPSVNESQILEATQLLRASDGSQPVKTQVGTWYAVADEALGAPIKELNAGKLFVLVDNQYIIRWPSIYGHVLSMNVGHKVDLILDEKLGMQMTQLTKVNVHNQLAIIVNGQVRSAPVINSVIGEQVSITGTIEPGEIKQLSQWLFDPIVYPLDKVSADPNSKLPQKPYFKSYKVSQIEPKQAYDVVSTMLEGKPDVRLAVDEPNRLLILFAIPTEHELVEKTLDELAPASFDSSEKRPLESNAAGSDLQKLVELQNNLRLLGLCFHNFKDAHGKFPGTSNTKVLDPSDSDLKLYPFSWRVAILPWIERDDLFRQYHFHEPWDSQHNLTLLEKMPAVYRSPFADAGQETGETNIIGFASEDSALGIGSGEKLDSFTDGTANTLLLVETECTVPWTKPQDIPGDASHARFFDDHPFTYLMANGEVKSNAKPLALEVLNEMISRNGNSRDPEVPTGSTNSR